MDQTNESRKRIFLDVSGARDTFRDIVGIGGFSRSIGCRVLGIGDVAAPPNVLGQSALREQVLAARSGTAPSQAALPRREPSEDSVELDPTTLFRRASTDLRRAQSSRNPPQRAGGSMCRNS